MSAPASVSATLSASSAAGGAMSAEGAMSNALAHVKAVKSSDEIKECFLLANSINTPTGNEPVVRVSTRQHFNIAHSNYIFARPSEYDEYIRQIFAKANIRFSEYANT